MSKNIFKKTALLSLILFLASCDKDEPEEIHEHEEFSRAVITVTNEADQASVVYTFAIEDHDHGDAGHDDEAHMEIELEANSSYLFAIRFYNDEDPNNPEDVTLEVIDEKDEHLVF